MFLHLGDNVSVSLKDVVAIFNIKGDDSYDLECESFINIAGEKKVASEIIVNSKGVNSIYLSQISSDSLKKRLLY